MAIDLRSAYREMLLIRRFEETVMDLKTANEIPGSVHLCVGQEAIPVGACSVLDDRDTITATYRGHGWAIARGVPLEQTFAELLGRQSTLSGGRGGSPYFSAAEHGFIGENSIVGAGVPIACGTAWAARLRHPGAVSVVSIGDGALSQGAVSEALNVAAAFALPLVIVVENNRYSEMTPVADMVAIDPLSRRAEGFGIPATTIDGNDVLAVREAVGEAVAAAREGAGPRLVEAMTERLVGHYSGDAQAYRPKGEVADAATREPLVRTRALMGLSVGELDAVEREVVASVQDSLARAREISFPAPHTALEHLYA